MKRPLIIAHRGASAYKKENTLEAFALAQKMEADGIEMDVWLTLDKVFVIQHQRAVGRGRRRRWVDKLTFSQIKKRAGEVLTLEKVFDQFLNSKLTFFLDLKNAGAERKLVSLVKKKKIKKIFFASNNGWQLQKLKKILPFCQTILYYEPSDKRDVAGRRWARIILFGIGLILSLPIKRFLPQYFLGKVLTFGADGVSLYHRFLNKEMVEDFHKEGIKVFAWGVEKERHFKKILPLGIDGVFTGKPDVVRKMINAE